MWLYGENMWQKSSLIILKFKKFELKNYINWNNIKILK